MKPKDITRFFSKVKQTDNCWIWISYIGRDGYGRFNINSTKIPAHRFSYELFKGDIPIGLELDHLCRNRACVNPEHLEPVTHQINILRGIGTAAINARKTHCPQGHPYSGDNLRTYQSGRMCRICNRLHTQESNRRIKNSTARR